MRFCTGSASASGPFVPLATLLLSNGSADGEITFLSKAGSPGLFSDQSGNPYTVAGATTSA